MAKCICGKRAQQLLLLRTNDSDDWEIAQADLCDMCGERVIAFLKGLGDGKAENHYEELLRVNEEQLRRITGLLAKNVMLEELLEKRRKVGQ